MVNRFANIHKTTADTTKYMKQVCNNVRIKRSFKICFCQTKTYRVLSMRKTSINAMGWTCQVWQWGAYIWMSFAAIVDSRYGKDGSNLHIRNTVIASIKMSCNRSISIIANDCTAMLTKLCPQRCSYFSCIMHTTSTIWDAVNKMGASLRFWCRNDGGSIYKITFSNSATKRVILCQRNLW